MPFDYVENGTGPVATYTASGSDAGPAVWSLSGDDAGVFDISAGVLTFKTSPDYEAPADADTNNVYMVTVNASDGTNMAELNVMVRVTDVEGVLAISGPSDTDYVENGTGAVATYTASGSDAGPAAWSLSGDDAGVFDISAGVLTFRNSPDYEAPADADTNNVYMVTVNASDGTNMAELNVMVRVTDVEGVLAISGPSDTDYVENGTGAVATYTASGPDAALATWSLSGDDAGAFMIGTSDGVLTFNIPPDYEAPADADMDNTYMVTVNASDGTNMDTRDVTVTVANVDEPGTVTLWVGTAPLTGPAMVDEALTGDVVDPDGSVTGESWRWMKADSAAGQFADITGATSASYTPVEADAGMYIKVMATYTDAEGSGKTAESPSVMVQLEAAPMTLLQRYAGEDGILQLDEVFVGIDEYFDQTGPITLEEVYDLIDLYFDQG